jgi:hypothetical protein
MASRSGSPTAWGLIIIGAVITLGSGVIGVVWLNRMPDLHPVPFGEQAQITASGSGGATIFTSTGQAATPACQATTPDGRPLVLGEPQRYQQSARMESIYGFTTTSGTTYTVSCGDPGQAGQFAVAEVSAFPEVAFLAVGSLGLLLSAAGGVLAWRRGRTPATHPA